MADTPSPVASSAAQANFQAKATSDAREVRRAGQSHTARLQAKTVTDEGITVETTDTDVAVFTNAEGQGGQGREASDGMPKPPDQPPPASVITTDPDGNQHIDVQI